MSAPLRSRMTNCWAHELSETGIREVKRRVGRHRGRLWAPIASQARTTTSAYDGNADLLRACSVALKEGEDTGDPLDACCLGGFTAIAISKVAVLADV